MQRAEDAVFPSPSRNNRDLRKVSLGKVLLEFKNDYVAGGCTTIIVCCVALFNVQYIAEQ